MLAVLLLAAIELFVGEKKKKNDRFLLQKTSGHCAQVRKALGTKVPNSIELFHSSCFKEVTSPEEMVQVVKVSMAQSLLTRTSSRSTPDQVLL